MALPRYLYSVNNSVQAPLIKQNSLEDDEIELANSADHHPTVTLGAAGGSDRFEHDVALRTPEQQRSDIYTSARLAAAGIPDPLEEQQELLGSSVPVFVNSLSPESYGTYDDSPPLRRTSRSMRPPSSSSRPSSTSEGPVTYKNDKERTKHEDAALYVREGEDNDKFYYHPRGKWSKRAYNLLHSSAYHVYHLVVCTLLLLLALMEHPYLGEQTLGDSEKKAVLVVHSLLEIFLLTLLWLDIVFRFLWFRPRHFFKHKRTLVILLVLVVMTVEAIVVLARQEGHIRITRALRPVFLLDAHLMGGVRRVLRQIFQCIRPIFDVLILLMLSLAIFSLLGYLIFAGVNVTYFHSYGHSLVSFFITMTTANHPDVIMEAYAQQPASPLFFVVYIIVMVYFISNVLLAVVYSSFSEVDKNKFRKLFLHKRDALRHAYYVLETSSSGVPGEGGIQFHDFLLFMQYYRPRAPEWQVMCTFKTLHKDPQGQHKDLSLEDFFGLYEVLDLKWKQVTDDGEELTWFAHRHRVIQLPARVIYKLIKNRWFNVFINLMLLINLLFLVIYTLFITVEQVDSRYYILNNVVAVSLVFVSIYLVEICLRIFAVGLLNYFRKPRNIIDSVVIVTSFILLVLEAASPAYAVLAVFRPIKFIRLLRLKRRYRNIIETLVVLSRRLISVGILLLVVYYCFAIIGLEFFNGVVHEGCCNSSLFGVGQYYSGNAGMNETFTTPNFYYLLNFDNIIRSYLTLFVLMVVNNWYVVMEGFASTSPYDWLVRLYFMSFYIITLVVLQVVISFIVEAFVFRIQTVERKRNCLRHPNRHCDCHKITERKKMVTIKLLNADIKKLKYEMRYSDQTDKVTSLSQLIRHHRRVDLDKIPEQQTLTYSGRRLRTKDDIYLRMYRSDLVLWIQERDKEIEQLEVVKPQERLAKILLRYVTSCIQYIIE